MSTEEPKRDHNDGPHTASTHNVTVPLTLRSQGLHSAEEVGELSGGGRNIRNASKQHSILTNRQPLVASAQPDNPT